MCVCTCVFSVCILAVCVCCMSAHGKGHHNPRTKCISSCCRLRVCVYVSLISSESLSLSFFPTSLSSPFQAASGTKLSPQEPEHIFAQDGVERGTDYIISLTLLMEADLEPRAKARSLLLSLARPRTAPSDTSALAEPDRKERESPTSVSQRCPNSKAAPIPLVWPGRGTKALAPVYPQGSIHQTNCRGLIVNQQ